MPRLRRIEDATLTLRATCHDIEAIVSEGERDRLSAALARPLLPFEREILTRAWLRHGTSARRHRSAAIRLGEQNIRTGG